MCVGFGADVPDIMNDKEKLRLARNLVKANNKRIKNTLRLIEIALEEIEKQRLEWLKNDKGDNIPTIDQDKTYFKTEKAEKELLNKLKESLS